MKKILFALFSACILFSSCSGKNGIKIGIAKIVQHPALDDIEKGVMDYINDQNIKATFDLQNANGDVNTATQIANQYKVKKVDVAVGIATPVAVALATTLKDIPVVFGTVTDPLSAGLVDTLDHGKNNVTGMSDELPTVEHIKLFAKVCGIKTLGYIYTSNEANSISSLELVKKGCQEAGLNLVIQSITQSSEVMQAAKAIVGRVDGIYLTTDNTVFSALASLVDVFGKEKKPIFSGDVTGAKDGGILMASGFNYYKAGRATGELVVKILNGEKPENIPVRFMTEPSDLDLLLNYDVAKEIGISLPQDLIDSADMIIENGKLIEK